MGQAQSARAPAHVTPLISGAVTELQRPPPDRDFCGLRAGALHRWTVAAPVDCSSTSHRQEAPKVFGYTNGISLSDGLGEVKCREEIVEALCTKIRPKTRWWWDDSHVQGRLRLCLAIRVKIDSLQVSKSCGAQILGIYGTGGIGKTTACKVLLNDYFEEFEGKVCHIEFGVGSKLQLLQEALTRLTETNTELIKDFSEDECKDRLKHDLKKKVLLAIDNVSDTQQVVDDAKELLRMGFAEGSIVIVTARSLPQLRNLHLEDCIHMPDLEEEDARSLFLFHAAPNSLETLDDQLVKRCIEFCKGDGTKYHYHPLALKVLGGQLGSNPEEWMEKLNAYQEDPFIQQEQKDHPIFSILGRSFDLLNQEDQLLFMDAAVFFPKYGIFNYHSEPSLFELLSMVHEESLHTIMQRGVAWRASLIGGQGLAAGHSLLQLSEGGRSGHHTFYKLEDLKNKLLLENLGDGSQKIGMHDLWHEFAVLKAKGAEFDSRPWIYERVNDRPRGESCAWDSLQRICMVGTIWDKCVVKELNLSRCSNLRVLKLVHVEIETQVLDLRTLPQLKSLEVLNAYWVHRDQEFHFQGLGCLRNLAHLSLHGLSTDTAPLHEELGGLTNLQVMHISHLDQAPTEGDMILGQCTNLTNLRLSCVGSLHSCHGVGDLVALQELDFSCCESLAELAHLGRLQNLLKLDISFCQSLEAVPGLGDLVSLQVFRAECCVKLAELPNMRKLVHLQGVNVRGCPLIKQIPGLSDWVALEDLEAGYQGLEGCHDLRRLRKVKKVGVTGWGAEGLPWFSQLQSLNTLSILSAEEVDDLTGLLNLTRLQELTICHCDFKRMPCLSSLTSLCVEGCDKLERLPDMTRLETLDLRYCRSLREWESGSGVRQSGTLLHLRKLFLYDVAFAELPDLSRFPQLRDLSVWSCQELRSLVSSAPLTALEELDLRDCGGVEALPDLSHLVSLRSFILWGCGKVQLTGAEIEKLEAMCRGLELDIN